MGTLTRTTGLGHRHVLVPAHDRHRHLASPVRRVPLLYHPSYWAMVFPLGMYGAATYRMNAAIDLDALAWLPKIELVVALAAWTVTFVGLGWHLATSRRTTPHG